MKKLSMAKFLIPSLVALVFCVTVAVAGIYGIDALQWSYGDMHKLSLPAIEALTELSSVLDKEKLAMRDITLHAPGTPFDDAEVVRAARDSFSVH